MLTFLQICGSSIDSPPAPPAGFCDKYRDSWLCPGGSDKPSWADKPFPSQSSKTLRPTPFATPSSVDNEAGHDSIQATRPFSTFLGIPTIPVSAPNSPADVPTSLLNGALSTTVVGAFSPVAASNRPGGPNTPVTASTPTTQLGAAPTKGAPVDGAANSIGPVPTLNSLPLTKGPIGGAPSAASSAAASTLTGLRA